MTGLFAIPLLVVLMAIGVPVAWSFAAVTAFLVWIYDVGLNTLMLQGFRSLNSVILLALPLFILTGYLMEKGGIARRIVDFTGLVARGRAGMGHAIILSSALFGAIAGTASAAVASMGTIMAGPMAERGYPKGYVAALLGVSSLLGILIPPSITMILFAVVTRQSVATLFAATIGPALLLIGGLMVFNAFYVRAHPEITLPPVAKGETGRRVLVALPALSLPVIILGGIYGGIFTPTEAAAVAAVAAGLIGAFVYRELTPKGLGDALLRTAEMTGTIIVILMFSFLISRILSAERIPQELGEALQGFAGSPLVAILMVNAILIAAGALMDDVSVTVVVAPLFLPLMEAVGISPVQYGAIVATSVVLGANSPPMAPILFMACRVCDASVLAAVRPALMILAFVALPVMLVTSFWADLSQALPRLMGML
ncbi:TRAP transporter large permease [Pararhodobacter sp. CCB-MM2]|uniref:TRAP transporter large permease n=1 Tax=Pararhodobacter sp. CCB-MM2 TaxID=1786003 RepID=UPI000831D6D2|nr:TRAP transporter large permease [Pararhodobacter sp. CCB-MM2]